MADLTSTCRCGTVQIEVSVPSRRAGTRVMCYCKDCQTGALALDAAEVLTAPGGTDIWQTTPDRLTLLAGADRLKILRLSPKGLNRWYANCCDTPMFNTLQQLSLPFVGVVLRDHDMAQSMLGPIRAYHSTASATPGKGAPAKDKGVGGAGFAVLSRMIVTGLSGRGRLNPLRTPEGDPIAAIRVLTLEERRAAQP